MMPACPSCAANALPDSLDVRRVCFLLALARVSVDGQDSVVADLCVECAEIFEATVQFMAREKAAS